MNDHPRKTTVTLEELLRLKRAEQPPAEFWAQFERGMRAKQLAAIVEPRPWWAPFIRIGARISRYQLPVGATAILAITFLTVWEYHPAGPVPTFEPAVAETTSMAVSVPTGDKSAVVDSAGGPAIGSAVMMAASGPVQAMTAADVPAVQPASSLGTSSHVAVVNSELAAARYVAENLAAAQAADPQFDQMLGSTLRGVESSPTRAEPLAQISVPGNSRRSRLLGGVAWLASANTGNSALRLDEQAAHHLTERRLSESDVVSRVDLGGDRVTVKF
jgi:hypothetical protein